MQTAPPDFVQLKSNLKASWVAGDFGQIANYTASEASDFVARLGIKPGAKVLDVACGTGNLAVPAARKGADATGVDIAPNLLEQARKRAAAESLKVRFEEGDAEELPFPDETFDVVMSMFGAMFAPRPERVAAELIRVSKPGGMIAMANWTPNGFVGKSFQITSKLLPPPPGMIPPVLWGDEKTVRQRFTNGVSKLTATPVRMKFVYPFSPKETVAFFRQYFGPMQVAFLRLDERGQKAFVEQLEALWSEYNTATDGTTCVETEYLEVRAIRD
jgi:ubiquinone/menaquinone biosynthesis C-methylase UbiE